MTKEERKAAKAKKKEGRRVRSLAPMAYVLPYIMHERSDATNDIESTAEVSAIEDYIHKKRSEGLAGFGMMHVFLAAFVRMFSQHPELNRFIRGQKIYARNCIEAMITIKREMKVNAPDTVLKLIFPPESTAEDVFNIINGA